VCCSKDAFFLCLSVRQTHLLLVCAGYAVLYMLMREQMILAVFVIALALRTETKLQFLIIKFSSSAYRTFVTRSVRIDLRIACAAPAGAACLRPAAGIG
jgi:hypothetical protein